MLLILTGSEDGTVDRIINQSSLPIFRLNIDLFSEYKFIFTPQFWEISDPTGRSISSTTASRVFWWKAFSYGLNQESFLHEELKYIFRELYSWFGYRNLIIGNPPETEHYIGKIRQLEIAQKFFKIPSTRLIINNSFPLAATSGHIVKSLTSGLTTSAKAMFTQEILPHQLEPSLPWYIQEKIDASADITVLVAGSKIFPYSRSRSDLLGLDWRAEQFTDKTPWILFNVDTDLETSIKNYCQALGISWGRLDFLYAQGEFYFLEINFNGQWAFLDSENSNGLITEVVNYIETGNTHSYFKLR